MDSFNHDNQADIIEAFNSTSRYLYDNHYFEGMVKQIYPPELQYSSKEVLHHLDFFIFLSDILTNKFST